MLGVRLDQETERSLDAIARRTRRPKSQIAREAIQAYVRRHDIEAIAVEQWRRISEVERNEPEINEILDFAARNGPDID